MQILVTEEVLETDQVQSWISSPLTGGICLFVGTVRNLTKGREVLRLAFEAYEPMAISEMRKIAGNAVVKWDLDRVALHHRTGTLQIGEIPVIIGVSAPHRAAAFAACQYCIDTLKETVPIWKKEIFSDGEVWVSAHP